jgi:hypothetical protein
MPLRFYKFPGLAIRINCKSRSGNSACATEDSKRIPQKKNFASRGDPMLGC